MTFVLSRGQDELHVHGESSWLTWDLKESDQALNREVVLNFCNWTLVWTNFVVILMLCDMAEEKLIKHSR